MVWCSFTKINDKIYSFQLVYLGRVWGMWKVAAIEVGDRPIRGLRSRSKWFFGNDRPFNPCIIRGREGSRKALDRGTPRVLFLTFLLPIPSFFSLTLTFRELSSRVWLISLFRYRERPRARTKKIPIGYEDSSFVPTTTWMNLCLRNERARLCWT